MPDLLKTAAIVDMTGFEQGFKYGRIYSTRTPADAVNTSACEVAIATKNDTPTVSLQTIDAELDVIVSPVIGKRGKPLKNKKRFSGSVNTKVNPDAPLVALIIQARANPNSRYNQLTNQRYILSGSPFGGVSREAGRAAMAALVHSMIANRHKSISFIKAGWIPVVRALLPLSVNKYRRGSSNGPPLDGKSNYYGGDLGAASPATAGDTVAQATIENDVGMEGVNEASHNRALIEYDAPILQQKVVNEGARAMQFFLDKSAEAELTGPVNKAWG